MYMSLIDILRRPLVRQIFRFGVAGSLSFVIDYGIFLLLIRVAQMHYALAAGISFTISVLFNWVINNRWVFSGSKLKRKSAEMVSFIVIAIVGLGINELILWVGTELLSIAPEVSKLVATALVAVWNFVLRKWLLYQ